MASRCSEARKVLRDLDKRLAESGEQCGLSLSWTPHEQETLTLIADQIDRKAELYQAYQSTEDMKLKARLSSEIRLLENSIARLLKSVETELPTTEPMSQRSRHAQRAALSRWARDRGAAG